MTKRKEQAETQLNVRLSHELLGRAREAAEEAGEPLSRLVRRGIEREVQERESGS